MARNFGGPLAHGANPKRAYEFLRLRIFHPLWGRLRRTPPVLVHGSPSLHATISHVNTSAPTPLCWLMRSAGSDKGLAWHNYSTVYSALFDTFKEKDVRVFELGIGTNHPELASSMGSAGVPGASLYGWRSYFPTGPIYGADIDRSILFSDDRIETFYCDQLDPAAIAELWHQPPLERPLDVIIEDGLHTFDANTTFLEHSLHKLSPHGYYVVEDIHRKELARWGEKIRGDYARRFPEFEFALIGLPWLYNKHDNNLLIVRRSLSR